MMAGKFQNKFQDDAASPRFLSLDLDLRMYLYLTYPTSKINGPHVSKNILPEWWTTSLRKFVDMC